jgi:hypothetical protein
MTSLYTKLLDVDKVDNEQRPDQPLRRSYDPQPSRRVNVTVANGQLSDDAEVPYLAPRFVRMEASQPRHGQCSNWLLPTTTKEQSDG